MVLSIPKPCDFLPGVIGATELWFTSRGETGAKLLFSLGETGALGDTGGEVGLSELVFTLDASVRDDTPKGNGGGWVRPVRGRSGLKTDEVGADERSRLWT